MFYRLNAQIVRDNCGHRITLPVLFYGGKPIIPVVEYFLAKPHRSNSWRIKNLQALQLLFEYMEKNWFLVETPQILFSEFSIKLFTGTVREDGNDPSGLRWNPKSIENGNSIIQSITTFSDWYYENNNDIKSAINPWRKADTHESKLFWAAYHHRKNNSFLGHIKEYGNISHKSRVVTNIKSHKYDIEKALAFPEESFNKLIIEGFAKSKQLYQEKDLRNILITLLMHWGGLRLSECFHVWVSDILPHPKDANIAVVKVYHPQHGSVPGHQHETRETYLRKIGMLPRNLYAQNHKLRSGWKEPLLDNRKEKYFYVYWADEHARTFMKLWRLYRDSQRVEAQRGNFPLHPYAFTNQFGDPYSYKKYVISHGKAIERIGLLLGKNYGTTPHSHRHAVGVRLDKAKVHKKIIQKILHHKSEVSQEIYKTKNIKEVHDVMNGINIDSEEIRSINEYALSLHKDDL